MPSSLCSTARIPLIFHKVLSQQPRYPSQQVPKKLPRESKAKRALLYPVVKSRQLYSVQDKTPKRCLGGERTELDAAFLTQKNGKVSTWKTKTMILKVNTQLPPIQVHYVPHMNRAHPALEPIRDTSDSSESDSEHDTTTHEQPDMISLRVRPPQSQSDVNGSVGGEKGWAEKIHESPEMLQKRLEGQKRADERELVRCAADPKDTGRELAQTQNNKGAKGMKKKGKGKDKGGEVDDGVLAQERRKKCEAVMSGNVVEASYAKGEWGIRWRE